MILWHQHWILICVARKLLNNVGMGVCVREREREKEGEKKKFARPTKKPTDKGVTLLIRKSWPKWMLRDFF